MRAYWHFARAFAVVALRDWPVLILTLVVPTLSLATFTHLGIPPAWGISIALVFAIVANGLLGAGLRLAQDRQLGVFRRLQAAPVSSMHIVLGCVVGGVAVFAPGFFVLALTATAVLASDLPSQPGALFVVICLGVLSCRSIGALIAAITKSVQQTQALAQIAMIALMATSGIAWAPSLWPPWVQSVRHVSPTDHLAVAVAGLLEPVDRGDGLLVHLVALGLIGVACLAAASGFFRWDVEEEMRQRTARWIWVAGSLGLFVIIVRLLF